jgi:hypothetical protein
MSGIRLTERSGRVIVLIGYALLLAAIAVATANIDPFNSDTVANLVALSSIMPDGTLYAVAHTNALKAPLYMLSLALFGYSQNALAFIDIVSAIGFNALLLVCMLRWTRAYSWPHLAAVPLLYLAALSPFFVLMSTNPGLRNLDIGVSFVWLGLVLSDRPGWRHRLLAIPLAAVLVLNDPWFVTTFAMPAFVVALALPEAASSGGARSRLEIPAGVGAGVGLGFALRSVIETTGVVRFVGSEADYRVAAASQIGSNLGLAVEVLLRYFNAWVFGLPLLSPAVIAAAGNLLLCGFGVWGLVLGLGSSARAIRQVSLFTLVAASANLALYALTNAPTDMWSGRYVVFAPIAVVIGLALLLIQWHTDQRPLRFGVIGLLIACLVLNASAVGDSLAQLRNPERTAARRQILEALKKSGLVYGYSDYWNSLNYTFLSGDALRIRAVSCERGRLAPREWWTQSRWYAQDLGHRPSFVLINATDPTVLQGCRSAALIRQFGPATYQSIDDGGVHIADVLIWDYDIASRLSP